MEHTSPTNSHMTRFGRRASMLVAVLVVAVLVGSLIAVLNLTHRPTTTGHGVNVTPTSALAPTTTPGNGFGQTLYTKSSQSGFYGLSWSPDSKRIASLTAGVQIWDATTGKHLVNVHFPGGSNEDPSGLSWSPNSQLVAITTNQYILVANSQTGAIVYTYPFSAAVATSMSTSDDGTSLSARVPSGSGLGFGTPVWSPDGKLIAVTVYDALEGSKILVWNPQTNAVVFEISGSTPGAAVVGGPHNAASGGPIPAPVYTVTSWSSDGQYLAGTILGTCGEPSCEYVAAWKVSTHQLVFKVPFNSNASLIGPIWQPHSDNLAFAQSDTPSDSTLEIWNVLTKTQIKQYALVVDAMTWSPDGKYLAYVGSNSADWVSIIDANSGQLVYTYKGHTQQVSSLAWSPNGKYIVSGEGQTPATTTTPVAKVWTAE